MFGLRLKIYFIILFISGVFSFVIPTLAFSTTTTSSVDLKLDTDSDTLTDQIENKIGTDPYDNDSDDDGYLDGEEVQNGFNPLAGNRNRKVKRRVEVNLTNQTLNYFFNNVKIGTMPVSSGIKKFATPVGEYKIMRKLPVHRYTGVGYDYPNTKWNLEFKRGFYLHTAYWHNEFGKRPMSHGCVNMALNNVKELYQFLDVGDKVKVYGITPNGAVKKVQVAQN